MASRKQKVEAFLTDLHAFKRVMTFKMAGSASMPRITPSQWGALMCIEERDESTVKEVAKALSITSSAATQLIDGLVENGYVARKTREKDRRAVTLTLSKKTRTHISVMKKRGIQKFLTLFEVLNDEEFDQYLFLNKKIIRESLATLKK